MPEREDLHIERRSVDSVEIRSEAIQEVLGRPPVWIVRWGITLIFSVVLVLIIGCIFFRYPDIVTSEVVITSQNPPSWVLARSSGKLQRLFVKDKQVVHTGDLLALIDNPASPHDVLSMKTEIDSLADFFYTFDVKRLSGVASRKLKLGELQDSYVSLIKQLQDYERFVELDFYHKKRSSLVDELEGQKKYCMLLKRQHALQEKDAQLAEKQFKRETKLSEEKIIADLDYENAEKQVLTSRRSLEQSNINISNAEISLEQMKQNILELDLDYEDKLQNMQTSLQNAYEQLKAKISIWDQQYVMKAQVDGVVSFNQVWSENHQVAAGDKVFAVIPDNQGEIIGKVKLEAAAGSGKVKVGQSVNIKLDGYPYMEYGMIKGVVTSISLLPADKSYTIELSLPNGLISFYNRKVDFTGELTGIAEISTDELSVMERFFQPLKYLFEKNVDTRPQAQPKAAEKETATQVQK